MAKKRWKLLGLAGVAGVAATGVVIARAERRRNALTPDDVRARLHQRYQAAGPGAPLPAPRRRGWAHWCARRRSRVR